jgi:hypothetical protein
MSKAKKKKKSSGSSGGGVLQFFVWHGEKFVVAVVVVIALWFAWQGLGYPALSWVPDDLDKVSNDAQTAIRQSTRSAEDEKIVLFEYDTHAKQIRLPISAEPYRTEHKWNTEFNTRATQRSSASSSSMSDY